MQIFASVFVRVCVCVILKISPSLICSAICNPVWINFPRRPQRQQIAITARFLSQTAGWDGFWTADVTLQNVSCHNKSRFRQLGRSLHSPNKHLLQVLRFFDKTLFIPSVESTRQNHVVGALLCTWKLSADGKHAPHREGLQSTVKTHDATPLHSAG